MQISTRTEDFIIDTLKLRIHVGPYLREVFKDPTKKKVCLSSICIFYFVKGFFLCVTAFNLIRSCMEQIEMLYGFNGTLAYTSAICLTLDRFFSLKIIGAINNVILIESCWLFCSFSGILCLLSSLLCTHPYNAWSEKEVVIWYFAYMNFAIWSNNAICLLSLLGFLRSAISY